MSLLSNLMKGSASAQRRIELAEVQRLTQAIAAGSLSARANVNAASGEPQAMLVAVNELLDAALLPIGEGNRILDRIAHGKVDELVEKTYQGDHERMRQNVNGIAGVLQKFQAELAKLTEFCRQGQLSKRGDAAAFPGTYGDVIKGVNEMLDTMIAPLNVAANCVEQISRGAIPSKITDNYNGDFNAIKTNLKSVHRWVGRPARRDRGCPKNGQQRPHQKGGWKLRRNLCGIGGWRQCRPATSPSRDFNVARRCAGEPGGTSGVQEDRASVRKRRTRACDHHDDGKSRVPGCRRQHAVEGGGGWQAGDARRR